MENKVPIICLASWLPNELDNFEGDFILRKLEAVAQFRPVYIFHVKKYFDSNFNKEYTSVETEQLTTNIIYLRSIKGFIGKIKTFLKWFSIHQKFLKDFIAEYGQPKCILVQVPYNTGLIAWYWKRKYGIQYIVTEHYGIYNTFYEQHYKTRSWLYRHLVKKIIANAQRLITVSHSLAGDINQWVIKKEHIKISNVVDTSLFQFQLKPPAKPFVFCHLSNMIPVKNIDGMLQAIALLAQKRNDFSVQFIGKQSAYYAAQAKALDISKYVSFEKSIPYYKVASTLQKAHCLLMFSNTESQSCISLEALCTGTPVVSSKAGGIEEHLDTSNSIMVQKKDYKALANAMDTMIESYDQYKLEAIAKTSQAQFNYNKIGKEYDELIENVLSQ